MENNDLSIEQKEVHLSARSILNIVSHLSSVKKISQKQASEVRRVLLDSGPGEAQEKIVEIIEQNNLKEI